jgi:hypothetical protein
MAATQYGVTRYRGKPVLTQDGKPVVLPSYCSCGPRWGQAWVEAHRRFVAHGRKVFWLMPTGGYNNEWGTTPFWTGPGKIHEKPVPMPEGYMGLDQQAAALLALEPQARFFVRMMDMPPAKWFKANADDTMMNSAGRRYESPSLASEKYLAELRAFLRVLTGYCERATWADRIIGYVIYPLGEGGTPMALEGYLFDQAPVMQRAFRDYLKEKYRTEKVLRQAWHDDRASLGWATVPRDDDFRQRNGGAVLFWPEARQVQRERDYFELQTRLFRRYLKTMLTSLREAASAGRLFGLDALKASMAGWMCHAIFAAREWKEHYGDWILATGTTGMAEILDWPELDIVATPHDYRSRWVGFGYDPEGIGDSVVLHGKVMFVEEDQRSYANDERGLFGSIEPGEEEAALFRNLAASVARGQQTYPMDVCVGYFEAEAIQKVLRQRVAIEEEFLHRQRQDVPSVVMLVDDRAGLFTDFSAEYNDLAVIRQRIGGMNHCGAAARTYLFDDLRREDFPACHRLFLLPNCFRYGDDVLAVMRDKLFRTGNVIVFGPGSAITEGDTVSPEFAADMLGMDFELYDYEYPRFVTVDNWDHPVTQGFGACETFGDALRYGPVLVPFDRATAPCKGGIKPRVATVLDGGFTRLASLALDNGKRRPGLVIKEFGRGAAGNGKPGPRGAGDYAVAFTTAVPLPARLLRNLARYSGTHVYDEAEDVVYADSTMVAVHAVMPGERVIRLPASFTVADVLSGAAVGDNLTEVRFRVDRPVTRWFRLQGATGV